MGKGKHFSEEEKLVLRELVLKRRDVIENKKSDTVSIMKKRAAWEDISNEFKARGEFNRTSAQLKKMWENIKTKRKSVLSAQKREALKTGGGPFKLFETNDDPELDALGVDVEILEAIDSDTTRLPLSDSSTYQLVGDVLIPYSDTFNESHEDHVASGSDNSVEIVTVNPEMPPLEVSAKRKQHEAFHSNYGSFDVRGDSKKKRTTSFSIEAKLRIERAQYLLDLDKELGELRKEEMKLKIKLAQIKIQTANEELKEKAVNFCR